jgi:hypothetical protein
VSGILDRYTTLVHTMQPWRWRGQVVESIGHTIESAGPVASVGECCEIEDRLGTKHRAEVIGFRGARVISMPMRTTDGVRFGDSVTALGCGPEVIVGEGVIGQILDGMGIAMDGQKLVGPTERLPLEGKVHAPLDRVPIHISPWHGHQDDRWTAYRRPRSARRHLWRIGCRQEHAYRHHDAQHRSRCDGGWPGGRTRARGP